MVKIGIVNGSEGVLTSRRCFLGCDKASKIVFKGDVTMAPGSTLKAVQGGILTIGDKDSFNYHCTILCKKSITIGDKVMTGWNILISDGDGHTIENEAGNQINNPQKIVIGHQVWLGANTTILKGVFINDNSIIGMGSIVTKSIEQKNVIAVGIPARVVKEGVEWHH